MIAERKVMGALLLVGLVVVVVACALLARRAVRSASGIAEAEPNLEVFAQNAALAYARDGKLCGSSLIRSSDPYSSMGGGDPVADALDADEARQHVGFRCLGVTPASVSEGFDAYVYEASPDGFVVRASRAVLYDPDGKLPRYERRGQVIGGKVVLDPRLHRVAPGGRSFPGGVTGEGANLPPEPAKPTDR